MKKIMTKNGKKLNLLKYRNNFNPNVLQENQVCDKDHNK